MRLRTIVWLIALLYVTISILFITPTVPKDTDYTYDVKVEQAYDVDRVEDGDVTGFENLSADEQSVLYEAFKEIETGQMFGEDGAEVRVTFDKQRASFETWRTVEVNGIVLLVAVDESSDSGWDTSITWVEWWGYGYVVTIFVVFGGLIKLLTMPAPPRY